MQQCLPFTVLKLAARETIGVPNLLSVATVLTVYGIETTKKHTSKRPSPDRLQQCLPFTVLKRKSMVKDICMDTLLQQCLPFTVLKLQEEILFSSRVANIGVATVLTVYGIET